MNNCRREKKVELAKKKSSFLILLAGVGSLRAKEDYSFHGQKSLSINFFPRQIPQPAVRSNTRKRHA